MRPFIDLTGKKFGKLTAVDPSPHMAAGNRSMYWKCNCDCGGTTEVRADILKLGMTKSCGCLPGGRRKKVAEEVA